MKLAVVGAGIVGLNVALEGLRKGMEVTIFEEASDVGRGASGHTAGVIHVLQLPFKSWKSKLALKGNPIYDSLSESLGFRVRRLPALLVYKNYAEKAAAFLIAKYLKLKGFNVKLIDKKATKDLCPDISRNITGSIKVDGYGTVIPLEVLKAYVKFLKEKNVDIHFNEKVIKIKEDVKPEVITNKGTYIFDRVVVSAGGGTKDIIKNIGSLEYVKGTMVLTRGIECNAIVAALFSKTRNKKTKGGGIIPWPDGRILFGPSFEETNNPWDINVSEKEAKETMERYLDLLDSSPKIIEYFAGTRIKAPPKYDFVVNKKNDVIVIYGIDSPGFTAAPALAKHVINSLTI